MYTAAAVLPRKIDNTINDLVDAHSQQINAACLKNASFMPLSVY